MAATLEDFLVNYNKDQAPNPGSSTDYIKSFLDEELRQASIIPPKPPANWFGEATAGVARGTTELKQMFQGAGALGASFLGAEDTKDWFIKGYLGSEQELQDNPASVPSYKDINSFGSLVRYAIASVGEISPMIAESLVTGGIGSLAALSETATGAVAKQAVGKLLSTESKAVIAPAIRTELSSYLEGGIAREALSPAAQELATPATKLMAQRFGANGAIAGSSIAKEGGGIYGDLLADPNVSESDRRVAGLVGGIIAAIPDTFVQGWVVDKFLHGTVEKEAVSKTVKAGIMGYLTRFAAQAAPEMVKTFGAEGGQEVVQTIVELASKNWADPAHRYDFLSFTPQQWDEVIDSGLKGGLGGAGVAIPMTTVMSMRTAHPDPKVREGMKDTLSKADDFKLPSVEVTPEHTELSNLEDQILAKQTAINQNPETAAAIQTELTPLQARAEELSAKLYPKPDLQEGVNPPTTTEPPLVNQKQVSETTNKSENIIEAIHQNREAGTQIELTDGSRQILNPVGGVDDNGIQTTTGFVDPSIVDKVLSHTGEILWQKKQEVKENQPSPLPTADEQLITSTRAFYAQETPNLGVYTQVSADQTQKVANQRTKNNAHIDEIAKNNTEYAANLKTVLNQPGVTEMMAHENVSLVTKSADVGWEVDIKNDGTITMNVPYGDNVNSKANPQDAVVHELGHIHDLIQLRDQWRNGDKSQLLTRFVDEQYILRGQEVLDNAEALPSIFKDKIAETFKTAYDPLSDTTKSKKLSALTLGQEIPRMMWEWARTGKLDEATDALSQAAQKNNKLELFLREWIDSIRKAGEWLKRFITGDSTPQLKAAYDAMNQVADKYGILVNQNRPIAKNETAVSTPATVNRPVVVAPNPVTQSLAQPAKPQVQHNARHAFLAAAKTGNQADTINRWLDWRQTKNDVPTTKSELASSLVDLNARLKTPISQKAFNKIVKERNQNETSATKTTSEPAKKAGVTESAPNDEQRAGILQPEQRGTERYQHGIVKVLEEKATAAGHGKRIAAIREYLETKHPWLTTHFDNIVREVQSYRTVDPESIGRLTSIPVPMRGEQVARDIQEYQYALYIPESINYISQDLGNARGIKVIGLRDFPEGHYVIDTSGIFLHDELVNPDASVHPPVQITDKLREAQLITKMQESYSLASVGYDDVTVEAAEHFDNYFGVNKWWIKSNDPNAMQGRGVYAGGFVKNKLSQNPNFWKEYDASDLFVQRALDTPPNPNVLSNIKILKDREIRVHVITSPIDGSVSILPFSTFWKVNDRAAGVSDMTPIVIENEDIREAHRVAVETIESAPNSDKRGQMYGADLVKLVNGSWGFVEANATEESALSGFFVMNALSHDSYMAALLGERPIQAELALLAHESIQADTAPTLVNQNESSTPARKPTFTPVVERQLDQLQEQANTALNRDLEATLKEGKPETKLRGNRPDIVGYTATDLEYQVEHQSEPIQQASDIISKHGLWKVLDAFIEQSHAAIVRRFNIEERDGISGEADTVMAALRQQVIAQLHNIIETLTTENDSRTRAARSWLQEQFEAMEKLNAERGTIAGRVSSLSGKVFKIVNGARAARDYFEAGSSHLLRVLGIKAQPFVDGTFSQEVNALRAKYMSSAMNSSKMLALLGELNKRIHTKQYQKDARATLAANEQQLRNTTKSTAAQAAEHVSMDELGEQWANEVSARMVKMMNGLPRGAEKLTELELFNRTVAQIVRENADQAGLLGEQIKNATTIAQQFAVVINNEGLYREFTNTLTNKIFAEYKPEPGSEFAKQVLDFRDQMANHLWRDGLVTSLVNEKLKQYQTTLSEIVKKHIKETNGQNFKETHELAERMRDDVRTMMEAEGVTNEGLLNRMIDDVESNLRAQIEQKRLDFLGSTAGGREFLRHLQTTIGEKAKEHALSKTSLFGELHTWLSDDLGIPDDMAQALSNVMDQQLGRDIAAEREAIVRRRIEALKTTLPPKQHKQVDMAMKKLLTAVNLGVMRDEEAYNAFAEPLGLPPWNAEVAAQADKLGAQIATASKYNRPIFEKQLSDLMEAQKGINPYDMGIAAMYANMLAGPSTHLVNIISTAGSITGHAAVAIIRNPRNTPHILSAMWRAALGEAQVEMREAFWNGHTFSKEGKYWHNLNPLEIANPIFKSKSSNATTAHIAETAAEVVHKLYTAIGAKYVGRALVAADVFFYKVAQEAGFAAKVGDRSLVDQNIIATARTLARREVQARGINPDENRHTRRQTESLAYRILNDLRLKSTTNPTMVDDNLREAWLSSGNEAVDATFNGDPKGLLGKLSKVIEKWTKTDEKGQVNPIGKMLVPFTKVSANVTNQMVEWTPFGLIRFGLGGHDFLVKDVEGNLIRNKDIAVRAILGTGAMIIMASILSKQDEDDPWLALFANGPRDAEARRQMLDRGWKPNTLKVGNYYLSYMSTPLAMPFAILGRMMDDHRDGKAYDPLSFSAASVAMLQTVTSQSFLASIHDVMAAVDSPTPEKNASRIFSRLAIGVTPLIGSNLVQQIDKWVAPSIQQADGFWESYLKNLPVVRGLALQPMLNVFGEPVHRTPGLGFIPGLERFITMERGDDPIYNVLGQKRIRVPGFSKTAKLGDEVMTHEQYYEYVQTAGPLVKQALEADLPQLRQMTRENAQEHVDKITRDIKQRVRQQMKSALVN